MRNPKTDKTFPEQYRLSGMGEPGKVNGAYSIPFNNQDGDFRLHVIASNCEGWDHVSVSLPNRCPTWEEMCFVKELFFEPEECVMQLHPPTSEYVNCHPYCLHMWRPHPKGCFSSEIPRPPQGLVGSTGRKYGR